jgi:hypothetical protein
LFFFLLRLRKGARPDEGPPFLSFELARVSGTVVQIVAPDALIVVAEDEDLAPLGRHLTNWIAVITILWTLLSRNWSIMINQMAARSTPVEERQGLLQRKLIE